MTERMVEWLRIGAFMLAIVVPLGALVVVLKEQGEVIQSNSNAISTNTRTIRQIAELVGKNSEAIKQATLATDRWRVDDHQRFVEELKRLNPNLKLPEEK